MLYFLSSNLNVYKNMLLACIMHYCEPDVYFNWDFTKAIQFMVEHYKLAHLSILIITKYKIHCEKILTIPFETVFFFQIPFLIIIPIIFMSILYWMSGKSFFLKVFVSFHLIQIINLLVIMHRKRYFTAPWLILKFDFL